jgi:hypothetical protein
MIDREVSTTSSRAVGPAEEHRLMRGFCTLRCARSLSAIVPLQLIVSCATLRPVPGAGLARVDEQQLGHVKVVLRDRTEIELVDATISPDSIVGLGGVTHTRWAVARTDVARVETRRTHVAGTFLLGLLAPVAFALLYVAAMQAGRD